METKKQEIILIAVELFSKKGYEHTSVEEIAKESGMAKGSFYKYFQSKDDLLFEVFSQLPKQFKEGLKNIYIKQYGSSHERVSDFIAICFENIFSSRIHFLLDMVFKLQLFKNVQLEQEVNQIEQDYNIWLKEFLLDIYGEKIEAYIGDLVYLLKVLIFQYAHLSRHQKTEVDIGKLTSFIATIFEVVVEGLCEKKPEPAFEIDWVTLGMCDDSDSPRKKGMSIQLLLHGMTSKVKNGLKNGNEQQEYLESLTLLEEECTKKEPKLFLLKALIQFLQSCDDLHEDCERLKVLLEVE